MKHIYKWLDENVANKEVKKLWDFIDFKTMSALYRSQNKDKEPKYRVLCIYEGRQYRMTGASRLGDVWLNSDRNEDTGYTDRVDIEDCSHFEYPERESDD